MGNLIKEDIDIYIDYIKKMYSLNTVRAYMKDLEDLHAKSPKL